MLKRRNLICLNTMVKNTIEQLYLVVWLYTLKRNLNQVVVVVVVVMVDPDPDPDPGPDPDPDPGPGPDPGLASNYIY